MCRAPLRLGVRSATASPIAMVAAMYVDVLHNDFCIDCSSIYTIFRHQFSHQLIHRFWMENGSRRGLGRELDTAKYRYVSQPSPNINFGMLLPALCSISSSLVPTYLLTFFRFVHNKNKRVGGYGGALKIVTLAFWARTAKCSWPVGACFG